MTFSERNIVFKAGITFCAVITLLILATSVFIIPLYSTMEESFRRPAYIFQVISSWFLGSNYYAVHISLILAVIFSLVGTIWIYLYFERTSAPEILYISFFTISFSFEAIRLIHPLHFVYHFPLFYLLIASRVLLFARYFSLFSLFMASVFAAGLEVQRTRYIIIFLIIAVLLIVLGAPIDTQSWDTSFSMISGYSSMFKMIEIVVFFTTSITFFVAAKVRDSNDYIYIGIGVMLALIGRNILLGTDNWAGPVPGIFLLSFGTWFICSKLHKIHLWL
jgi:hypothetical protein